jgi:DNA-binding IclR family transcriptional regulator
MPEPKPKQTRKPTLVSGLALIERLAMTRTGESVTELARAIDMDIGQAHRLLAAVVEAGYVFQDATTGHYRLTPKIVHVAATLARNTDVVEASRDRMRELRGSTGETVHVAACGGESPPVCVARELSLQPVSVASNVGEIFPFNGSAIGEAVVQAMAAGSSPPPPYTVDDGHYRPGVVALAAPLRDWTTQVVGAIAVSGPAYRVAGKRIEELGQAVAQAAAAISEELGHRSTTAQEKKAQE